MNLPSRSKSQKRYQRFGGNFSYKTTYKLRGINFKVFKKLLRKSKLKVITLDIDSSVINVEGHQEGAVRGYNPKKPGSNCSDIQFAFCDELKAYITGFVRSSNTYTAKGTAEMIKEIVTQIKTDDLGILFRMDSGYFDEEIFKTIEPANCQYLIKGKEFPTLASQVRPSTISFTKSDEGRETTELVTKLDTWNKERRFVVSRRLKPKKDSMQLSFLDDEFEYFYFVTNTELPSEKVVIAYEKRGNTENHISTPKGHKEAKYDMAVGHLLSQSF